jgi:hypothetical protein
MSTKEKLYKFIQLGLGSIEPFDIPANVEWKELVELASAQGVVAISFDGYQKLGVQGILSEIDFMRWYGYSNLVKTKWHNQLSSSSELAYNWKKLDIRTLVLKGFSFALYYPNPSSRPASDLDCYLCGRYEDGNRQVEEMGIEVHREDYGTLLFNIILFMS